VGAAVGEGEGSAVGRAVVGLKVVGRKVGDPSACKLLSSLLPLLPSSEAEDEEGSGTVVSVLIIAPTPGRAAAAFAKSRELKDCIAPKKLVACDATDTRALAGTS
jgi:hypothetical protein